MVKSVEYNEKTGTLKVKHHNGNIDKYFLVPPTVYEKYFECESADEFFRKFIKGKFPHSSI